MPKIDWNKSVTVYPKMGLYGAAVSAGLPATLKFDKTGKRLPTPYGLFQEWLKASLSGYWATAKMPGGFVIGILNGSEQALVVSKFGPLQPSQLVVGGRKVPFLRYQDAHIGVLANQLGYSV
jgi:hypothetical protein